MNKEAQGFNYFVKNCTFDQLTSLRSAVEELKELGLFYLPYPAFEVGNFNKSYS
jgi:hypothetical protein